MLNLNLGSPVLNLQTPNKRIKGAQLEQLTAESEQETTPGIEDINADVLFEQFTKLVRVSEEEDMFIESPQVDVQRKLNYDPLPSVKLMFEPKSESMKKYMRHIPIQTNGCLPSAHLFRPAPIAQIPKNSCNSSQIDFDCFTPVDRPRKERPELLMTPHKEMEEE